jgi:lysophospholipase L1-like esterase
MILKKTLIMVISLAFMLTALNGATILTGTAVSETAMTKAAVTIYDAAGKTKQAITDAKGIYSVAIDGLKAPLLINAVENGYPNFSDNGSPRGKCVAALLADFKAGAKNTANLNPMSDKIVSDIAKTLSFKGPVGLILSGKTDAVKIDLIKTKTDENRKLILQALKDAGVKNADSYDPVTTPIDAALLSVFELIRHNRGYDTGTGLVGDTILFDINFHPISFADPLNYKEALKEKAALLDKNITRVFIAGDSTASYYESERAPRNGWAQTFQSKFKDDAKVLVVNSAISGRSSKSFINEGWYRMIEPLIKQGDYLLIQFGHNDEKCGSNPPQTRDKFDLAVSGTYPNDVAGKIQGTDDMSFQRWLEKYIKLAKSKNATPIILTPTTRINVDKDKKTGLFPIDQSTHVIIAEKSSAKYVGDYSQTIRDTAKANGIALIDIDAKSIAFANSIGEPGWKEYWLAIDPAKYPFYKAGVTGNIDLPDSTHFQTNGASKIAGFVAEGIKANPELAPLAKLLK